MIDHLCRFLMRQQPSSVAIFLAGGKPCVNYSSHEESMCEGFVYQNDSLAWLGLCDKMEEKGLVRPVLLNGPVATGQLFKFMSEHRTSHIFWNNADLMRGGKLGVRMLLKYAHQPGHVVTLPKNNVNDLPLPDVERRFFNYGPFGTLDQVMAKPSSFRFEGSIAVVAIQKKLDSRFLDGQCRIPVTPDQPLRKRYPPRGPLRIEPVGPPYAPMPMLMPIVHYPETMPFMPFVVPGILPYPPFSNLPQQEE